MLGHPDLPLIAPTEELERLLRALEVPESEVVWAVRVGSRVYGTAHAGSDWGYMVAMRGVKNDLIKREGIDVVVKSVESFERSMDDQNIFALECYHAPFNHTLKRGGVARWKFNGPALQAESRNKSDSDYNKAACGPMDYGNKKRLWHSLRVAEFAGQLWRYGYMKDFSAANGVYWDIMTDPSEDPAHYVEMWGEMREQLLFRLQ